MTTRRRFIKKISAIGATAPLINNLEAHTEKNNGPVYYVVEAKSGEKRFFNRVGIYYQEVVHY